MKNHYVSQFIIKRFANAINIFDIQKGKIFIDNVDDYQVIKK